jgi:transcriptional antiterminator RfaH
MISETESKLPWFLIHTNPKQEERTVNNLRAWNVEPFSPQIREWRYKSFTGERYSIVKPLFARYVFARFDLERLFHKVRYTRGVQAVVTFGDGPVEIDEEIITLIKAQMSRDGIVKIGTDLKPGDAVRINGLALEAFSGILEREVKDSERVVVLLNTVSYQARLQLDRRLVQKLTVASCSD